jgi:hypothetical protein
MRRPLLTFTLAVGLSLGSGRASADGDPRLAPVCQGWAAPVVVESEVASASMAILVSPSGRRYRVRADDSLERYRVAGISFSARRNEPLVWLWDGRRLCQVNAHAVRLPGEAVRGGAAGQAPPAPAGPVVARSAPPGRIRIDRAEVPRIVADLRTLTRGVRVHPEWHGGVIRSVALTGIRTGTFLSQLGLESGDRILAVDGQPITSVERVMGLYARLAKDGDFRVSLERRGAVFEITLAVE